MLIISLLCLSAEVTLGLGQAAPNEGARTQATYGTIDWGYHIWTNFFGQVTYVKGAPFGAEPYLRFMYLDHPEFTRTIVVNNVPITMFLSEAITSYELGFSRPMITKPPFHTYWGAGFNGNFCRWERRGWGKDDKKIIDQVTPGLVGFGRAEWWWKYRAYLEEELTINCIIGLSARFHYMGFRPDVWPCPDWFAVLEGYVGVRW